MTQSVRLAVTADLHWGHSPRGVAATRRLIDHLRRHPPEVLILAGDIGTGTLFADCLAQFDDLSCHKLLVPGNHDVWVKFEADHDSLFLYEHDLPRQSADHGFHYLDHGPFILKEADVAVVGSMNWYDYSWSLERLRALHPTELERLRTKRFSRGRHNDANFVRWSLDDVGFTARLVAAFERQLLGALEQVGRVIVVTHHPPLHGLAFPHEEEPTELDALLWDAFCGNRAMEELLRRHAERIAFAFCGHTHRARTSEAHTIRGFNIGGDYHFKRLVMLDWPAGTPEAHQFGDEA